MSASARSPHFFYPPQFFRHVRNTATVTPGTVDGPGLIVTFGGTGIVGTIETGGIGSAAGTVIAVGSMTGSNGSTIADMAGMIGEIAAIARAGNMKNFTTGFAVRMTPGTVKTSGATGTGAGISSMTGCTTGYAVNTTIGIASIATGKNSILSRLPKPNQSNG